ncbi:MADS-box transcription factor [Parasponia andersonii]|uniref:MADS-box transcription factor n=1 Tax=Parasponia andersonii TaxID=3476 RepID=A0A2P5DW25_PARAD|nr:MADS-box transcription factor [Parasponia andersonii]
MGRGKLKLELIANEKSRKTTFQKRKNGIMKKAFEFSILCDTDICVFVSGPKTDSGHAQTRTLKEGKEEADIETFPPENDRVLRIIQKYQQAVMERPPNKSYNLTGLLAERNKKVHSDISRFRKKFYAFKYPTSAELIDGLAADELAELVGRLDGKIRVVKQIIEGRKKKESSLKNVFKNYHDYYDQIVDMNRTPSLQTDSSFSVTNPNSMMSLLFGDDNQTSMASSFDDHHDHHHHPRVKSYFNGMSSNNTQQYGTNNITSSFRGPVYDDLTAGVLPENTMHYSTVTPASRRPVYNHPTARMALEKYMMMFNGSGAAGTASSSMQTHGYYYPPPVVQPMMVPYVQMQYPMNAMNVGPSLDSFQVASPASRGNELTDVVNDFLENKIIV